MKNVKKTIVRIGHGYDLHRLEPGRRLILAGVTVPFEKGLAGHSDADVVFHAVIDALLGGAGLGDIGEHFPDTDPRYRDIYSIDLLTTVYNRISESGFSLVNMDTTIFAQAPRMSPFKAPMTMRMADSMSVDHRIINIKATTTEGLGVVGKGDGIAAMCVVLLRFTTPGSGR